MSPGVAAAVCRAVLLRKIVVNTRVRYVRTGAQTCQISSSFHYTKHLCIKKNFLETPRNYGAKFRLNLHGHDILRQMSELEECRRS